MARTTRRVAHLAVEPHGTTKLTYGGRDLDVTPRWRRATLTELVEEHAGVHVDVRMPLDDLRRIAREHGVEVKDDYGPGKLVLEIYEKTTEAQLWGPVFVIDYPKEVSPLARDHREVRSEEHTSELQSLMRTSYAVFCLTKKNNSTQKDNK